jgi:hypothetical protein
MLHKQSDGDFVLKGAERRIRSCVALGIIACFPLIGADTSLSQEYYRRGHMASFFCCCYTGPLPKNTSSRTSLFRQVAFFSAGINFRQNYTEILCRRMSCIVAQTIVRQLVSVVKTSI